MLLLVLSKFRCLVGVINEVDWDSLLSRAVTTLACVAWVEYEDIFIAAERAIQAILITVLYIEALKRMEQLLINRCAKERYNLVLLNHLVYGAGDIIRFPIKQAN